MQKTTETQNERSSEIISIIKEVCKNNLNDEYLFLAENLCKEIFKLENSKLNKGKANSWACGIVHSIGLINGLFTNKSAIEIKASDFYKLFDVSSSTGLTKSKEVRSMINIDEEKWLISSKEENKEENKNIDLISDEKDTYDAVDNKCYIEDEPIIKEDKNLVEANKIANEAWNQKNFNKKVKLAKEALMISDKCAEAYIILSYDNSISKEEQKNLSYKAVEVAKEVIGEENIDKFIGKYLDLEITKPYYSAKYRLGNLLWSINERREAIKEFTDLLKLCPEDRLLIRGVLLSWLISEGLDKETEEILIKFKDDYLSATKFSKALYLFKLGKLEEAERALRIANASNPFVVNYITKQKTLPKVQPELKSLGSEEDAIYYVKNAEVAWDSVKGARNWVKEIKNRL
ncbi:MAG: DUF6398 domain-containing protein [Clostridium sp.]|uniref:DUF6398 domain-containing protein n=1 Tax=Clostridium sp. TaxID=1506 RepID=UPI002A7584E3|nr:DUF6398 domain-containing protein [Clostridium sp.]MCI6692817.1 DUF6398 domain-containing protein [Clostridium sp.]MDY2631550.1 DUF6398 domain-containing protein [Clostridium sp.]